MEDARAMVAVCREAGVPFMVHENFRWQYPMRAVGEAAADIGELFFGRVSFRSAFDVYANGREGVAEAFCPLDRVRPQPLRASAFAGHRRRPRTMRCGARLDVDAVACFESVSRLGVKIGERCS